MIGNILNKYFSSPVIYDTSLAIILSILALLISREYELDFTLDQSSQNLGSIGLTVSGFILTLLTILLTLKSNAIIRGENSESKENAFKVFLSSSLYSDTIVILRNGVLTLMLISFFTLAFASLAKSVFMEYGFYANLVCLIFILTTFLRCFWIINKIFHTQTNSLK